MSAARMSTASSPSRKTMSAEFVTTETLDPRAVPDPLLGARERIVERRPRRGELPVQGFAA